MDDNIRNALMKATKRSTHKRHQTGCVIVTKRGQIISKGCSHSSSFRMNELHSIHAEIHARWNARHFHLDRFDYGSIAYILTIARKSGNFVYSAPCLTCAITLKTAGIDDVWYSTGEDELFAYMNLGENLSDLKVYPRRKN